MQQSLKKFSPAVLGIALICFILPWVNFSCQGQHVATFTGLQLVTGTTVQQQGMFGQRQNQKVDSEPLAVAVLLLTILGVALSFLKSRKSSLIPSVVGVVAFIVLLLLKSKIETDATNRRARYDSSRIRNRILVSPCIVHWRNCLEWLPLRRFKKASPDINHKREQRRLTTKSTTLTSFAKAKLKQRLA